MRRRRAERSRAAARSGILSRLLKVLDRTIDNTDPGDETLRRYRYQAGRAALLGLAMLDDDSDVVEIFCEHYEDVLLRRRDGRFDGEQVKTRADDLTPLKAGDEPVQTALARFVALDQQFPNRFRRFVLSTNVGFWRERQNGSNLPRVLEQARDVEVSAGALPSPVRTFTGKLVKATKSDQATVINVLRKVVLDQSLPKLSDLAFRLAKRIGERPEYDRRIAELLRAAEALIELATRAGATTPDAVTDDYMAYADDPAAEVSKAVIAGKCLTPGAIRACIEAALDAEPEFKTADEVSVTELPANIGRAEKKMARGGITSLSLAAMMDNRASFEWEMTRRIARRGTAKTQADYSHLLALVRNEAAEVRDTASAGGEPYGTRMLVELRDRLRRIATDEQATARGLAPQQLQGVLTLLTELCDVWWSAEFDVDAEVAA